MRLHDIVERRHRCPVQAGLENSVQLRIRPSALRAVVRSEVVRPNRLIVAVRQGRSRWPVPAAFLSMALPAFQLLEELSAVLDACNRERWFGRNLNRIARFLRLPPR